MEAPGLGGHTPVATPSLGPALSPETWGLRITRADSCLSLYKQTGGLWGCTCCRFPHCSPPRRGEFSPGPLPACCHLAVKRHPTSPHGLGPSLIFIHLAFTGSSADSLWKRSLPFTSPHLISISAKCRNREDSGTTQLEAQTSPSNGGFPSVTPQAVTQPLSKHLLSQGAHLWLMESAS